MKHHAIGNDDARGRISPAFIGGCGLKLRRRPAQDRPGADFARLYWRVRIETVVDGMGRRQSEVHFARLYWRVRIETTSPAQMPGLKAHFARLYWRVRIETMTTVRVYCITGISPAFIGGCGLKPSVRRTRRPGPPFRPPLLAGAD